jgi:hypothetical protein
MSNPYPSGSAGAPSSRIPPVAPGLMQRRSSYASVVSGSAPPYQQPTRSGAFSHLLNDGIPGIVHSPSNTARNIDGDDLDDPRGYGPSVNAYAHGRLPSFTRAFGMFIKEFSPGGGTPSAPFVPTYLKNSKHVRKLQEAHDLKMKAQREALSTQSGSLSSSASSASLHAKVNPIHRGITWDVIEKSLPIEDDSVASLPTRWNSSDKSGNLEVLSDGQEVKFTGSKSTDRDHEAAAIRADHYMPPQCGLYYFEVTILSRKREEYVRSWSRRIKLTVTTEALLASDSRVKMCHYQGCQDGNRTHGHTTEMMATPSAARAPAKSMGQSLGPEIPLGVV